MHLNLSMLQFQNHLLAQISALNTTAKIPENKLFNSGCDSLEQNILCNSPPLKTEFESESLPENLKLEPQSEVNTSLGLPDDPEICFEAQIKYMVQLFVNNFGTASSQQIRKAKQKYSLNPQLIKVFEALELKYTRTAKTREEMVKWIIRRCLKITKASIKKNGQKGQKQALHDLCTRYFGDLELDGNDDEEDEAASRVLPFRKNSKNRTMNNNFVAEIFQSEEFKSDYKEFLQNMDEIVIKENSAKIHKLTAFVVRCVKKQNFSSIATYKRIPWLKSWIENTKKIAKELDEENCSVKAAKRK